MKKVKVKHKIVWLYLNEIIFLRFVYVREKRKSNITVQYSTVQYSACRFFHFLIQNQRQRKIPDNLDWDLCKSPYLQDNFGYNQDSDNNADSRFLSWL